MTSRILAVLAATTALVAAAPALADHHMASDGQAAALTAPEIQFTQWELDNGLTVIAIPDPSTATVMTSLWYEVGSKNDPEGKSGFAHLFEHILSRKTQNMRYNLIYDLTADVGGTRNASTGSDRTNYFEIVPAEYLETMLWTHRERMAFPVVDDEVFDNERAVVKEELRTRVLAPPYGIFSRFVIPENAYDDLPQRRPGIGSIEDLDNATLEDARAFHNAYYGPDTATLIVAGNFDMANLRSLVDEYFADIPRRENPVDVTIATREDRRTEARFVTAHAPNVPLPIIGTIWQTPEITDPADPALEVLAAILGRGENSRFYSALVEPGLAVQSTQYASSGEEGGMFASYAIVNPDADREAIRAVMDAEIARVRSEPVTPAELAEAKNELIAASLRSRETASGRAFELGEALVSTGDPRAADKRLAAIANVTAEDVMRVASEWLTEQSRTEITYERGEHDPAEYANPEPMPQFVTLPEAIGPVYSVLPEDQREAPPGPGSAPTVARPEMMQRTLANGVDIIAAQTGDVPIATMTVLLPGGSASDPRAKSGLANFAVDLAQKGTANRTANEIAARLESLGASIGGSARSDGTVLSLTAPVGNMEAAGEIFADILRNANYPAGELERERARTIDSLQVSLSYPGSLAGMVLRPVIYGDAPYGSIAGGTPESLAAITRDDLLTHRQRYWHPAEAEVIVSGGIAPEQSFALVENLLGDWTVSTPPPPAIADPAGEAQPVRTVVIDLPDAGQSAVLLAGRGPTRAQGDYFPLLLANAVLGGGSSGRLFEEIRTKRGLSYGSYSSIGSLVDDPVLTASAQTAHETVPEVVEVMLSTFGGMGETPLADDLLDRRRLYLQGGYARSLETSSGFNGIVADLLAQGIDPAEVSNYADNLQGVTAQAASTAAQSYFDPEGLTVIVVGDASQFIDDLRAIRPNVEVIPASELDLFDPQVPMNGG
ncbi:M16 family metallopeptidase [Aurantiacibacter spongiae]|uniref:Insulinase family protein n=1 Tax=Aurantiacibacter spongiae TaxID=2488860 RepID=A0A3N5CQU9_9SPHN|nr:pitrilysin family protein [Aurantiacibacter spongiae]RPF70997.1 insulinase family protein [Aurantiacibacter spongiae]